MSAQDVALAIVQAGFAAALLPTLLGPKKPHFVTAFATAFGLVVIAFVDGSLSLPLAAAMAGVSALLWFVLAGQVA